MATDHVDTDDAPRPGIARRGSTSVPPSRGAASGRPAGSAPGASAAGPGLAGSGGPGPGGPGPGGGGGPAGRGAGRGPGEGSGGGGGGGSSGARLAGFRRPDYPDDARARAEEGTVLVAVRVSASGQALEVSLAASSGSPSLDRAALGGVKRARFVPAQRGGVAVESSMTVSVRFRLDE